MRFQILFILTFTFSCSYLSAQNGATGFRAPVKHTMRLSGTFGELRANHFHAGIDIKGKIGTPILAIEDGYISRIRVDYPQNGIYYFMSTRNKYP